MAVKHPLSCPTATGLRARLGPDGPKWATMAPLYGVSRNSHSLLPVLERDEGCDVQGKCGQVQCWARYCVFVLLYKEGTESVRRPCDGLQRPCNDLATTLRDKGPSHASAGSSLAYGRRQKGQKRDHPAISPIYLASRIDWMAS